MISLPSRKRRNPGLRLFHAAWKRGGSSLHFLWDQDECPYFFIDGERIPLVDFTKREDGEGMYTPMMVKMENDYRDYAVSRHVLTWLATVAVKDCGFVADAKLLRATALALRGRAIETLPPARRAG